MSHERFLAAAERILAGDDSVLAANNLEAVVLDEYLDDDRFEELSEVLALYAPGQGSPYLDVAELRSVIQRTIARIG